MIGPVLLEALRVTLRHWRIVALSAVAIFAASLASALLIGWCLFSAACVDANHFTALIPFIGWIIWFGDRLVYWIVPAIALNRIISAESAEGGPPGIVDPGPRGLPAMLRCVLFFAALSVATQAASALAVIATAFLSLDSSPTGQWAIYVAEGLVSVALWGYVDARFSLYLTLKISGGRSDGFIASWSMARGHRGRLFLSFCILEACLSIVYELTYNFMPGAIDYPALAQQLTDVVGIPRYFLMEYLPGLIDGAVHIALHGAFCAGLFVAAYKRLAVEGIESDARIFA